MMKTAIRFGCIFSLIFAFEVQAQSKPTPLQPPVVFEIAGRTLTFTTVLDTEATSPWHYINVYDASLKKTYQASEHPFAKKSPVTCTMLAYLRAWLTEADNGVNGKKTKDRMPLPGAESEAGAVREISGQRLEEDCPKKEELICNNGFKQDACSDLKNLRELSNGIANEAKRQSDLNLKGRRYY